MHYKLSPHLEFEEKNYFNSELSRTALLPLNRKVRRGGKNFQKSIKQKFPSSPWSNILLEGKTINWHKPWSHRSFSTSCLYALLQGNKNGIKTFSVLALQTKDFQGVSVCTAPTPSVLYHIILPRILVLFSPISSSLVPARDLQQVALSHRRVKPMRQRTWCIMWYEL